MNITFKKALNILQSHNIKYIYKGDLDLLINNARSIDQLSDNSIGFYRKLDIENYLNKLTEKNLIIVSKDANIKDNYKGNFIQVDNPDIAFRIIASLLINKNISLIDKTSIINKDAETGENFSLGAFSYIGENVTIGDNCVIYENCVIKNAIIGNNVIIQSGVKIGNSGLGSQLHTDEMYYDFPHFGKVIIGDNIVIQDNTVINRGTLNDTIISDNCRIGPLSCIAHNVQIGKACTISQASIIAGSVIIGSFTKLWGNSTIRDGIKIGSNCNVGMGSVVTKNIPDNEIWLGNPAKRV